MRKRNLVLGMLGCSVILGLSACGKEDTPSTTQEETTTKENTTEETTEEKSTEEESVDLSNITYDNDSTDASVQEILQIMLGENESADKIVNDLTFDKYINKTLISYEVIETDVLNKKGEIVSDLTVARDVTVIVDNKETKLYFKFTVLSGEDAAPYKIDQLSTVLIHNQDNIRGNITLPTTAGDNDEFQISWACDRPDIISMEATGTNGEIPAGVVTRGAQDEKVTLTATFTLGNYTTTRDYELTVKAKPAEKEYSAYLYTYFRGNIYGNGESQHIHIATSQDGFFWTALNDNEPILTAELGTKGVRDSYLIRSPEGDHFYLIGTDLDANGGDWADYGNNGSRYIRVWESDDLVNWSEERLILIAPENAACMWAPECIYDESTGEYVVYWATGLKGGDGKKIWYAKTRDFYTFTEPQIYKDTENGITFIDTSMIEYQGTYYRFTKNENELSILMETSDSVLGDFSLVKTRIANEFGVEGPGIYQINGEERWVLYMDGYADKNSGVGYFPLIANSLEDLKNANFVRMDEADYEMPAGAKHGSFVPITQEEYDALQAKWGN